MSESFDDSVIYNVPATISSGLAGIPAALVPECLKALNRLIGAAIDVPVAWLVQKKSQIEAKTVSSTSVERSVGNAAALVAAADEVVVHRAMNSLLNGAYRKQQNRDAVALATIEDLASAPEAEAQAHDGSGTANLDDDWLNIFEKYVDDASSSRMQKLWGRVLAGEIRKPGRYSLRTLRFLAEFSQTDALQFQELSHGCFGNFLPTIAMPNKLQNNRMDYLYLASIGLFQGVDHFGSTMEYTFNNDGVMTIKEGDLTIILSALPNFKLIVPGEMLTPLGQELLSLVPAREAEVAAQKFASSIRTSAVRRAVLAKHVGGEEIESASVLWDDESERP